MGRPGAAPSPYTPLLDGQAAELAPDRQQPAARGPSGSQSPELRACDEEEGMPGRPAARPPGLWSNQETLKALDGSPPAPAHLQTEFQTILNTINLYVGVGLLSTGYAVRLGGWASLLVLALSTLAFSFTAKLLCYACDELPPGAVPSYPNLGRAALGPAGQWGVTAAVLLEFWGALGMCLIVLWQNLAMLLPPSCLPGLPCLAPSQVAILLSTAAVLPAVLVRSLSKLTSISLSGVTGSILLTAVVVVAYVLDPSSALVPSPHAHEHKAADLAHLPLAAGIFIVSLSGHAGLPSLRRSMARPENFENCINVTFACMFLLYATMGGVAYAYFGESLQVLVTGSLNSGSSVAGLLLLRWGAWSLSLSQALTALVALSVYSTIPPLVYVVAELVLDLARGPAHHDRSAAAGGVVEPATRVAVAAVGYATALAAYDVLSHVESLVGGVCSVLVSLILPALILRRLRAARLGSVGRAALLLLAALGGAVAVGITVINVLDLAGKAGRAGGS